MSGVIIFGSVWFLSKNSNLTKFFKKKTKIGLNRPISVQFGFLRKNRFGSVFLVFLCFFRFGSVFFSICSGLDSVWFFQFQAYKTEPVGFFKILIGLIDFFHSSVFSIVFFLVFSV